MQATGSVVLVRKFARRFDKRPRTSDPPYEPLAVVIVPFKGDEPGLSEHAARFCTQAYPAYRMVWVVESERDPAMATLKRVRDEHPQASIDLIVAGRAPNDCGQKVHNLLTAVEHVQQQGWGEAAWVFADSDVAASRDWLNHMVGPLAWTARTAVTTGYRWLVPMPDAQGRISPAAHIASIINSSIACLLGQRRVNTAWGGSMALLVSTAHEGRLAEMWQGALSDDLQMTRLAERVGRRVYFVPWCLVTSPIQWGFRQAWGFGFRQYLIMKVHMPILYALGIVFLGLYPAAFALAVVTLVMQLVTGESFAPWPSALSVLVAVCLLDQWRACYRRQVVRKAFDDATQQQLATTLLYDCFATPMCAIGHWLVLLSVIPRRTLTWRGIRYRLDGPQNIQRLTNTDQSHENALLDPSVTTGHGPITLVRSIESSPLKGPLHEPAHRRWRHWLRRH